MIRSFFEFEHCENFNTPGYYFNINNSQFAFDNIELSKQNKQNSLSFSSSFNPKPSLFLSLFISFLKTYLCNNKHRLILTSFFFFFKKQTFIFFLYFSPFHFFYFLFFQECIEMMITLILIPLSIIFYYYS